ncbi:MAG: IPT/TIG domain-containing protein [Leptospiraceae bacterium]|nr:IPT/TIG domain-containing protein [Leptospiraceae bacterium]
METKGFKFTKYIYLYLACVFLPAIAFAQTKTEVNAVNSEYSIEYIDSLDLSKGDYRMAIRGDNPDKMLEILKGRTDSDFHVEIAGVKTQIYPGSVYQERKNLVEFYLNAYDKIPSGKVQVKLFFSEPSKKNRLLDETLFPMPENFEEDKQPLITGLSPMGGVIGDTITMSGKNFGSNVDKIDIYFYDLDDNTIDMELPADLDVSDYQPIEYMQMRAKTSPFYISTTLDGVQHVNFTIPTTPYLKELADKAFFRKSIRLKVFVDGRPSSFMKVTILPKNWNKKVIALAIVVTVIGLAFISLLIGKWNFVPYVLLDKNTNTYSLSRFQAFTWTVVLTGSYFYIAIAFGILLQNGKIPEFNPSLVGLMSISYTGFIASHFLNKKNPKNAISDTPPALSDLFMENGVIDITRLQLLLFTVVAVVVYLYNLYLNNTLNGLPDIPATLHGLLVSSQTGYIGGKVFGDKIAVNRILPRKISISEKVIDLHLIGAGFVDGMKLMIEGSHSDPVLVQYSSPSTISCSVPMEQEIGNKNLVIIPPSGSTMVIPNAIEIVEGTVAATEDLPPEPEVVANGNKKKKN